MALNPAPFVPLPSNIGYLGRGVKGIYLALAIRPITASLALLPLLLPK